MAQSVALAQETQTVPGYRPMMLDAATIGTGMAFLNAELEKRDARLLEPMTSVTYPRDIVIKTGGGWVEYSSQYGVNYGTTGGQNFGVIGSETTDIPVVQADLAKDIWQVYTWGSILRVPFVDQKKLEGIGRSLNDILDNGVRLIYNKALDQLVYTGYSDFGGYGIINNPSITAGTASENAGATSTLWVNKTPQEILNDVNNVMVTGWENSQYDLTGMPNHILIDPANYAYIVGQPVTSAGSMSILNFLLQNNIGQNQGVDLQIVPSRWCTGAGAGGTNRMVGYVNAENRLNMDLTVPISRQMTAPDVQKMAYLTNYAAQFSQVKFLFDTCVVYTDGI